jgi:hypothetical protein
MYICTYKDMYEKINDPALSTYFAFLQLNFKRSVAYVR